MAYPRTDLSERCNRRVPQQLSTSSRMTLVRVSSKWCTIMAVGAPGKQISHEDGECRSQLRSNPWKYASGKRPWLLSLVKENVRRRLCKQAQRRMRRPWRRQPSRQPDHDKQLLSQSLLPRSRRRSKGNEKTSCASWTERRSPMQNFRNILRRVPSQQEMQFVMPHADHKHDSFHCAARILGGYVGTDEWARRVLSTAALVPRSPPLQLQRGLERKMECRGCTRTCSATVAHVRRVL